ncbi:helix-turn-helix domain-containing protein [Sphingomonas jatrophae]|uniref:DNA-binding transcriptional regulator, XRE family n=1 Tax=Sphingomonas jatrophae TaxID=1166337 RepID=A0A1I6M0N6_9SPHN|nr:helix-turn-helix transcriptional regulator [Sphingomonas jatrophae]SFS09062.1 DNA-binding transcriptional regulator, XRE family [Sphingomonas jatrophae]
MIEPRHSSVLAIVSNLKRELKARGVRVRQLAEELGVAEPTVWRWLRGEGLTLVNLDAICTVAGLDLRDVVARGSSDLQDSFTPTQERVLAADRGLALVFFSIVNGAQREQITREFGLAADRVGSHLDRLVRLGLIDVTANGRIRPRTSRLVRWRRGGPLATAFEKTVKSLFLSMDFSSSDARYVSDMVSLTETGLARVHALFEALREDVHLIGREEEAAGLSDRVWSGVLMMVHPLQMSEVTNGLVPGAE